MTVLAHEKQIFEVHQTLLKLKEQNKNNPLWTQDELHKMEKKLDLLKKNVYDQLKPWGHERHVIDPGVESIPAASRTPAPTSRCR